jgi:hypothetical protein
VAGQGVDMNDKIADQYIVPAPKPRWTLRSMQKKRSLIILSANTSNAQHWTYLSWLILTYVLKRSNPLVEGATAHVNDNMVLTRYWSQASNKKKLSVKDEIWDIISPEKSDTSPQ